MNRLSFIVKFGKKEYLATSSEDEFINRTLKKLIFVLLNLYNTCISQLFLKKIREKEENMKFTFKVFNPNGEDVSNKRNWYLDTDGNLCYEVGDIDFPVVCTLPEEGYRYEIILK